MQPNDSTSCKTAVEGILSRSNHLLVHLTSCSYCRFVAAPDRVLPPPRKVVMIGSYTSASAFLLVLPLLLLPPAFLLWAFKYRPRLCSSECCQPSPLPPSSKLSRCFRHSQSSCLWFGSCACCREASWLSLSCCRPRFELTTSGDQGRRLDPYTTGATGFLSGFDASGAFLFAELAATRPATASLMMEPLPTGAMG